MDITPQHKNTIRKKRYNIKRYISKNYNNKTKKQKTTHHIMNKRYGVPGHSYGSTTQTVGITTTPIQIKARDLMLHYLAVYVVSHCYLHD